MKKIICPNCKAIIQKISDIRLSQKYEHIYGMYFAHSAINYDRIDELFLNEEEYFCTSCGTKIKELKTEQDIKNYFKK